MISPAVAARYTPLPINVCAHCGETDSPEDTRHWPDDDDGDRICPPCAQFAEIDRRVGTRFRDVDGREWKLTRKTGKGTVVATNVDGITTWFAECAYAYPLPKGEQ